MAEPVANGANRAGRIIPVVADVLAADVGQIGLVTVTLAVKNGATLLAMFGLPCRQSEVEADCAGCRTQCP